MLVDNCFWWQILCKVFLVPIEILLPFLGFPTHFHPVSRICRWLVREKVYRFHLHCDHSHSKKMVFVKMGFFLSRLRKGKVCQCHPLIRDLMFQFGRIEKNAQRRWNILLLCLVLQLSLKKLKTNKYNGFSMSVNCYQEENFKLKTRKYFLIPKKYFHISKNKSNFKARKKSCNVKIFYLLGFFEGFFPFDVFKSLLGGSSSNKSISSLWRFLANIFNLLLFKLF